MSQWTHVAGIIRLDSLGNNIVRGPQEVKRKAIDAAIKKALGNICNYSSSSEEARECNVPSGNEGSLQYRAYPNSDGDEHSMSWGYVAIWGDLRGFGAAEATGIEDWFQKSLFRLREPEGFGASECLGVARRLDYALAAFLIRDAVLSIEVGGKPKIVLSWDDEISAVKQLQGVARNATKQPIEEEEGWPTR